MSFLNAFKILFLERGEGGRKTRKHQCVVASHMPPTGNLATQACALTGNQTSNPLVHRLTVNPLSYASQGNKFNFFFK